MSWNTRRIAALVIVAGLSHVNAIATVDDEKTATTDDGKTTTIDGFEGPATARGMTERELGSIALEKEMPSMANRRLRMRIVTIAPDGIVPLHSHADRPAIFYLLRGEIDEHRSSTDAPVSLVARDVSVEAGVVHWWRNSGAGDAVLLVADIVASEDSAPPAAARAPARLDGPGKPVRYEDAVLARLDLATQIAGVTDRHLRLRAVTVGAGGVVPVHPHMDRPALFYVLTGEIEEYRSDERSAVTRATRDFLVAEDGVLHWWRNTSGSDAVILVADLFNTSARGRE